MLIKASLKCNHTLLASLLSIGKRTAGLAELWQLTTKKPIEELRKNASTAQCLLPTGQKRHGHPVVLNHCNAQLWGQAEAGEVATVPKN